MMYMFSSPSTYKNDLSFMTTYNIFGLMIDAPPLTRKLAILVVLLFLGGFLAFLPNIITPTNVTQTSSVPQTPLSYPSIKQNNNDDNDNAITGGGGGGDRTNGDLSQAPSSRVPSTAIIRNTTTTTHAANINITPPPPPPSYGALIAQRILDRWRASMQLSSSSWWGNDMVVPPY